VPDARAGRGRAEVTSRTAGPPAAGRRTGATSGDDPLTGATSGDDPPTEATTAHDLPTEVTTGHDPSAGTGSSEGRSAGPQGSSEAPTRRARLWEAAERRRIPLPAILATVGVVVGVYLAGRVLYALRSIVLLVVVASFVALLLNPLVVVVQRIGRFGLRRRGVAVGIVTVAALAAFAGIATLFGVPLTNALVRFFGNLPSYVDKAEHGKGWIGHLVQRYHLQDWVRKNAPKLQGYAKDLTKPAFKLGTGAVTLLIDLFAIFMLTLLLLLEGPKLRSGVLRAMEPARARRLAHVAAEVNRSVTGYMLGNFITSVVAGLVVWVTLLGFGVPYSFLWALWVALVDFLPMIGGALAGIPTVLFAFTQGVTAGVVTAVVFLVYTQVENHVLNPVVMSRTVRINPLLVLLAILVGANLGDLAGGFFGGFVGTLLAIPVAGSLQVIVRELWQQSATQDLLAEEAARVVPEPQGRRGPDGPTGQVRTRAAAWWGLVRGSRR